MISRHFYREFKKILRNFQPFFRRFAKKSEAGTKLGFSYKKNVYMVTYFVVKCFTLPFKTCIKIMFAQPCMFGL